MQNLRYALRGLRRQPLFTLVAVLTLAVGIGANTAIFSLLYQVLLRPLPYAHEDRLVYVWNTYPLMGLQQATVSIPDYLDRRAQAPAIEDATLFNTRSLSLSEGEPEQIRALRVTPSFFSTLGRQPVLGRGFTEADATEGADQYAILTHSLWTSHFAADQSIVNRDIRLDGVAYRVVGVLPDDFDLPARDIGMLVPFSFTANDRSDNARGNEFSMMIARLAPGATREQLDAQMKAIVARNLDRLPQSRPFVTSSGFSGYSVPIREQLSGNIRAPLLLLQVGVLLVLLIACANVANLLLMRATGRHREVAIRSAIGAGRGHVIRQLLVEGLVLSVLGAFAGVVVGVLGVQALLALAADQLPGRLTASLSWPLLGSAAALAILTGLVFGLVPAASALRTNVIGALRDDSTRGSATRATGITRASLVVVEVALAVMLLIGAGLLIKSFSKLQGVDPGFSADNVLTAQITLPMKRYPDADRRRAFWAQLLDEVKAIPGVTHAGLASNVPFSGNVSSGSYGIVGYTLGPGETQPHGRQEVVGGDYFRALQIPLASGRWFDNTDTATSGPVVVIDKYLVDRYFKNRDPLGQQITRGGQTTYTIVGVAGTINAIDLGQPVMKERLYYPVTQQVRAGMAVMLKTPLDPQALIGPLRDAVRKIDREQPIANVRTMDQWMSRSLQTRRAPTILIAVFGGAALVLSGIGIYGVLAFGVAQRTREMGIRQALGADRGAIVKLVLGQGLRMTAIGVLLGWGGAVGLSRFLESQLFGVSTRDVAVFAGVAAILIAVALAACYIPARRTTRIDPMKALRDAN